MVEDYDWLSHDTFVQNITYNTIAQPHLNWRVDGYIVLKKTCLLLFNSLGWNVIIIYGLSLEISLHSKGLQLSWFSIDVGLNTVE